MFTARVRGANLAHIAKNAYVLWQQEQNNASHRKPRPQQGKDEPGAVTMIPATKACGRRSGGGRRSRTATLPQPKYPAHKIRKM